MDALTESIAAALDHHPDVQWHQLASVEPTATFLSDGDAVVVHFRRDETAWRVSFEVRSTKTPTQLVACFVGIIDGVFWAMREFQEVRHPERLTFTRDHESLGELYEAWTEK